MQCHVGIELPSIQSVSAIDPKADRPVYKQLADLLRDQILRGELRPGQRIPAENTLAQEHGISRDSVRKAMGVLRTEGLITTELRGSYVRDRSKAAVVRVDVGTRVASRMPTPDERLALDIPEGTPIFVISRQGRPDEILPADRTVIEFGAD